MARYLVQRLWDEVDEEVLDEAGRKSLRLAGQYAGLLWEHSHVTMGADERVTSFCVYTAEDMDAVLEHARLLGDHTVMNIFEIGGDVRPDTPVAEDNTTRFLVERLWEATDEDELAADRPRSRAITAERFPDIVWEHTHVVSETSGGIRTFCVYQSPTSELLLEHARVIRGHRVMNMYEIGGDVRPEDFTV